MKKKILRYLICALTLLLQYNVQAQNWYYYGEEKIILEEKTNKVVIKKSKQCDISDLLNIIKKENISIYNQDDIMDERIPFVIIESNDSLAIPMLTLQKISELSGVISLQPMLEYNGNLCGIIDEFGTLRM